MAEVRWQVLFEASAYKQAIESAGNVQDSSIGLPGEIPLTSRSRQTTARQ